MFQNFQTGMPSRRHLPQRFHAPGTCGIAVNIAYYAAIPWRGRLWRT
jgi:hypothetical protein